MKSKAKCIFENIITYGLCLMITVTFVNSMILLKEIDKTKEELIKQNNEIIEITKKLEDIQNKLEDININIKEKNIYINNNLEKISEKLEEVQYKYDDIGIIVKDVDDNIKMYSKTEVAELEQLVQSEAGNQDLYGMQLVTDVVLNRVESDEWPNTIHEVVHQEGQFEVLTNGMFEEAKYVINPKVKKAVRKELTEGRQNYGIIYFATYPANGKDFFKYRDHFFSY